MKLQTLISQPRHTRYIVLAPNFGGDRGESKVVSKHTHLLAARNRCQAVRDAAVHGTNESLALVCQWDGDDYSPLSV